MLLTGQLSIYHPTLTYPAGGLDADFEAWEEFPQGYEVTGVHLSNIASGLLDKENVYGISRDGDPKIKIFNVFDSVEFADATALSTFTTEGNGSNFIIAVRLKTSRY